MHEQKRLFNDIIQGSRHTDGTQASLSPFSKVATSATTSITSHIRIKAHLIPSRFWAIGMWAAPRHLSYFSALEVSLSDAQILVKARLFLNETPVRTQDRRSMPSDLNCTNAQIEPLLDRPLTLHLACYRTKISATLPQLVSTSMVSTSTFL